MVIDCPLTTTTTELPPLLVMEKIVGSNVRIPPALNVVVPVVPSVAINSMPTVPEVTSMVTLPHVMEAESPAAKESVEIPQKSTVAEPVLEISTPFVRSSVIVRNDPPLVMVPNVVPSLKSEEMVVS